MNTYTDPIRISDQGIKDLVIAAGGKINLLNYLGKSQVAAWQDLLAGSSQVKVDEYGNLITYAAYLASVEHKRLADEKQRLDNLRAAENKLLHSQLFDLGISEIAIPEFIKLIEGGKLKIEQLKIT